MRFFQTFLSLSIVLLLGLGSTGICDANPNTTEYESFFTGTYSLYTFSGHRADGGFEGTTFGGFTAYWDWGGHTNSIGFGILGSYGVGLPETNPNIQIANISPSFSYSIGKLITILASIGFTYVRIPYTIRYYYGDGYNDYHEGTDYDGYTCPTVSMSYLYQPTNRFRLMVQGQLLNGVGGVSIFDGYGRELLFRGRLLDVLDVGITFSVGVGF